MSDKEFRVGIDGKKVVLIVTGKRSTRYYSLKPKEAMRVATYMLDGVIELTTGEDRGFNEEWAE